MNRKGAKRWLISGEVQGVGFRYFVQQHATELGLTGWTRNLADGRVEVYASGTDAKLREFSGALHKGPRMAEVRSVEEKEEKVEDLNGFAIR